MSYYIKQIGTKDCGFASLKMLLAIVYKNKNYLYYSQTKKDEAYSLLDLMNIANKENVHLKGYKYVNKDTFFRINKLPCLVVLKVDNSLHMVLIKKITKRSVLIYDPKKGIYKIKKDDFKNLWNGEILEIEEVGRTNFKCSYLSPIPLRYKIFSYFFQILSLVTILGAMFFSDSNYSFFIPLLLLLSFIISEIAYKKLLISSMKYFDSSMIDKIFDSRKKFYKDKYIEMNKFKSLFIGRPIQIINAVVVVIAGGVILGLNSYLNVINILFIISVIIIFEIIEYKYFIKNDYVTQKETELFYKEEIKDYKETLISLQKKVYRQVGFISYKKYIVAFLIGVICLLYAAFTNEISLNFILFHVFLYFYIGENVSKIMKIYLNNSEYRQFKCLYKYYCDEI